MKPYPWSRLRSAHYDEIVISPHMDDAVYSCGGRIVQRRAEGARILVVTVFGNGRDDDRGSGVFGDMAVRKREERAAMDLLDIDHLFLNLPDLLVRAKPPADLARYAIPFVALGPNDLQRRLAAAIAAIRARFAPARLSFPLAVGAHPDHRLVFEVGAALADEPDVWFYEDVPYVQVPALREDRLHQLGLAAAAWRWSALGETHSFVMAHAPAWQRPFTWTATLGYWLVVQVLSRLRSGAARARAEDVRDISDVIDRKVAAMLAYETQTAYFYPPAPKLYEVLCRQGERYVERSWQLSGLPKALAPDAASIQRESTLLEEALS